MNILIKIYIINLFIDNARGIAIIGDNVMDVTEREFPFVVAISDVSNEVILVELNILQFCTGSLITYRHVLTAQHCLSNKEVDRVHILVGSDNLDQCQIYYPELWTTYQEWKYNDSSKFPSYYHDIAVITLKDCVTESNTRPAIISMPNPRELFDTNVKITGWGETNGKIKPKILRTVNLKVISQDDCEYKLIRVLGIYMQLLAWHLCSESDPWALNACGDSGGPLLNEKNEIIAITTGTCPNDVIISKKHSRQDIIIKQISEKKLNLHTSLQNYQDFLEFFTRSDKARECNHHK